MVHWQFTSLKSLAVCVPLLGLCDFAGAQARQAPPEDKRGTVSFVWENDRFSGTDRNYTNGARISWLSGTKKAEGFSGFVADIIGSKDTARLRNGFAIGQTIFTPANIETSKPLPNQHPYAGWLYGEFNAVIEQDKIVDTFALKIGVIGPSAGGEFAQNNFHKLIGVEEAQGWDNQIQDEIGVNFSYDKKYKRQKAFGDRDFGADITPNVGFTIGTINTHAHAGLTARIGQNLGVDFGPPRVAPALGGAGSFTPKDNFSWYLFAGAEGRAVAHNRVLDGSLFRDGGPKIGSKTFVTDYQAGIVMQYLGVQIGLTVIERSREFKQQESAQRFGAFSLSVKT